MGILEGSRLGARRGRRKGRDSAGIRESKGLARAGLVYTEAESTYKLAWLGLVTLDNRTREGELRLESALREWKKTSQRRGAAG